MIDQEKLAQVFAAVEQGAGLRQALRAHAHIEPTEQVRDWILQNHHVDYLEAKRKARDAS